MSPDMGNALFEAGGAILIWLSVRQLWKDRVIKGVYWPAWFFYMLWGLWNLYYYPSLDQWLSFSAGVVLVSGNAAWVSMAVYLKFIAPKPRVQWSKAGAQAD